MSTSVGTRTTLCLPIDVARLFDTQVTQAQLNADTFVSAGDDPDQLASMIEDAEDEFTSLTRRDIRVSRVGVEGQRETFEDVTHKLSGHKAYRQAFSHFTFDYDYDEVEVSLDNSNVLPFDSAEGDAVYVYNGIGDGVGGNWEDITDDQGDMWAIVSHTEGILAIDPLMLHEALLGRTQSAPRQQRLRRLRLAVSYRYGGLGGGRGRVTATDLNETISASQTGVVDVADGTRFPSGSGSPSVVVKINREYLEVDPDPTSDQMDILTRGVRGTDADSHDSGDRVQYTPPAVRKAVAARAAMQLVQSNRYRGFLPDTEDDLDSGDVMSELGEIWSGTVEAMA